MDVKSQRILIITVSLIAVAGVAYFLYQRRRETEILKQSVEKMTEEYDVFN